MPLKPQDLVVCLELSTRESEAWTYADLAADLGLSPSETNKAVERALEAGLLCPSDQPRGKPIPIRAALLEFLVHGVRHAFFTSPGRLVRGMPTAHSAPPLDAKLRGGDEPPLVWPDAQGDSRGQAIEPLYPTVPAAARKSAQLYELLALTDSLRCGRARERKLAAEALRAKLND
ncbi:MAG: hypothetical protein JKY65_16535 [Planctomycetes bacterium]|nr:hypothetical protein [Planctomycetota bacterium]